MADSCALPTCRDTRLVGGSSPREPPACGDFAPLQKQPGACHACTTHSAQRAKQHSAFNLSDRGSCFSGTPAARFTTRTALPLPAPGFLNACAFSYPGEVVHLFHKHWGMTSSLRLQALDLGEIPPSPAQGVRGRGGVRGPQGCSAGSCLGNPHQFGLRMVTFCVCALCTGAVPRKFPNLQAARKVTFVVR